MAHSVQVFCDYCRQPFARCIGKYNQDIKYGRKQFCSRECQWLAQDKKQHLSCNFCSKMFIKRACQIRITENHFCSRSCSASYSNRNKTKGSRRSKLEAWVESQLSIIYPQLEIHYNRKNAINAELDIYIPLLNLAIELNGIFHDQAIYGDDKLSQIQNNDRSKVQACHQKNIELHSINTSSFNHFKIDSAQKYLEIVTQLIDNKLANFKI
ncbi:MULTISPECIES: hypothetical protein [unclassified Microcoleus]|uniref:hypothetical protein n=1 Tax=unclassified Microcoleus TaxID=2642155 RepID=UPI002FD1EAFA